MELVADHAQQQLVAQQVSQDLGPLGTGQALGVAEYNVDVALLDVLKAEGDIALAPRSSPGWGQTLSVLL